MEMPNVDRFFDEEGRLKSWPSKRPLREAVLSRLAESFEKGRTYTEKEINAIIEQKHTFGDYFLLRRELVEAGILQRTRNGAQYWRKEEEAVPEGGADASPEE